MFKLFMFVNQKPNQIFMVIASYFQIITLKHAQCICVYHEILFNRKDCGAKIANMYTLHITNIITFNFTFTFIHVHSTTVLTAQKDILHGICEVQRYNEVWGAQADKRNKPTKPNTTNPANFFLYLHPQWRKLVEWWVADNGTMVVGSNPTQVYIFHGKMILVFAYTIGHVNEDPTIIA